MYLAASALEIARAKRVAKALSDGGVDPVATWISNVEAVGLDNPSDATKRNRYRWSASDLTEVSTCDVVLMLVPSPEAATRGAWFEMGFAFGCAKVLMFSGDTKQSVFCALGEEHDTDAEAVTAILSRFEMLRAKLRHGYSLSCDRCRDTLTLSSMTIAALEGHLLRTALELGWLVGRVTAKALGSKAELAGDRDLCPSCGSIHR